MPQRLYRVDRPPKKPADRVAETLIAAIHREWGETQVN